MEEDKLAKRNAARGEIGRFGCKDKNSFGMLGGNDGYLGEVGLISSSLLACLLLMFVLKLLF